MATYQISPIFLMFQYITPTYHLIPHEIKVDRDVFRYQTYGELTIPPNSLSSRLIVDV